MGISRRYRVKRWEARKRNEVIFGRADKSADILRLYVKMCLGLRHGRHVTDVEVWITVRTRCAYMMRIEERDGRVRCLMAVSVIRKRFAVLGRAC